jgi:hypothetical protein
MREITGVWLNRDRKRIAVQLDEEVIWVTNHGPEIDVEYEVDRLTGDGWDELFPETDFS